MTLSVTIINTGVANIASIVAAIERMGGRASLTTDPDQVVRADHIILPGVGSFAAGMGRLQELKLVAPLKARINRGDSTLAICLGFQMLCEGSEESPGVNGLGLIAGVARRFDSATRSPQLGWNTVSPANGGLVTTGDAYFANSYCLREPPDGWQWATTDYGGSFVSALWRDRVLACQFHPELSGAWGQTLLERWIGSATRILATHTPGCAPEHTSC